MPAYLGTTAVMTDQTLLSRSLHPRAGRQILNTDTMKEAVSRVASAVPATESRTTGGVGSCGEGAVMRKDPPPREGTFRKHPEERESQPSLQMTWDRTCQAEEWQVQRSRGGLPGPLSIHPQTSMTGAT